MQKNQLLELYAHQERLFDPRRANKVVLLGAGAVGSHVAYNLAKMGVSDIEVWDADHIASHNVPMSLYGPSDIGRFKVDALEEIIERLTGTKIRTHRKMYEGESLRNVSVVACVDDMEARKLIWKNVKLSPTIDVFCDTRTAASYIEVLCVTPCDPEDIESYEAMIFDEKVAARQSCGEHGIIYTSTAAAERVTENLALFWLIGAKVFRIAEQTQMLDLVVGPHH